MNESKVVSSKSATAGDAAVDGLLSGIVAGVVMAVYLVVVGLVMGEGPGIVLSRFDPGEAPSPLTGALMHLAVAGVYCVAFGPIARWIGRRATLPGWLIGLVYGLGVLLIAEVILLPGTNSPLREIPVLHFGVAHVVYGLTLGWRAVRPG